MFLVLDIIMPMITGYYLHVLKQIVSTYHMGTHGMMATSIIRKWGSSSM